MKSAVPHFHKRQVIRKTWGYENRFSDVPVRTVFLLGKHFITLFLLFTNLNNFIELILYCSFSNNLCYILIIKVAIQYSDIHLYIETVFSNVPIKILKIKEHQNNFVFRSNR